MSRHFTAPFSAKNSLLLILLPSHADVRLLSQPHTGPELLVLLLHLVLWLTQLLLSGVQQYQGLGQVAALIVPVKAPHKWAENFHIFNKLSLPCPLPLLSHLHKEAVPGH